MKVRIISLSKNEDFRSILNGKKISNKYSTIFFKKLDHLNSSQLNISFIAKKKLGNAVIRNKIKRRLKNIMRDLVKQLKINCKYSYLIIAKKIVFNDKFLDIKKELFLDFKRIKWSMRNILIFIIKIYKRLISPYLGSNCRYLPTCSDYFIESLKEYGLIKGTFIGIKRILTCHPIKFLGGSEGYDPVLKKRNK